MTAAVGPHGRPAVNAPGGDESFRLRPLRTGDLGRVLELEQVLFGPGAWSRGTYESELVNPARRYAAVVTARPGAGERLVGYAEVLGGQRGDAAVDPRYLGRGIGTWLARWMQQSARARAERVVGMPVPQGSPGDRLLESLGYFVRWTSWVLTLPEGAEVPERPLPAAYDVRTARPDEAPEMHGVLEDAFLEWSEREREPFGDFEAQTLRRPGFEPWNLRVVTDPDGRVAAAAVVVLSGGGEAYVDRLATRADQRHRGLAQALLVDAFRVGREHGATSAGLATDSRTGALGLYEKVGMRVFDTWLHRAIEL